MKHLDTRSGTTTVTLTIVPPNGIYVDGAPVAVDAIPALLRQRDAGDIVFRYVGPESPKDLISDIFDVVIGTGDYAFGWEPVARLDQP